MPVPAGIRCAPELRCGGAGQLHHSAGAWGNLPAITGLDKVWGFRVAGHWCGIIGGKGFFLAGHLDPIQHNAMIAAFFSMMLYAIVAVTILLAIPVLALVLVPIYARKGPELWGFPFFYWYQLLWVFLAAALCGTSYLLLQRERRAYRRSHGHDRTGGAR